MEEKRVRTSEELMALMDKNAEAMKETMKDYAEINEQQKENAKELMKLMELEKKEMRKSKS